jgi:amidohydrolase
MLNKAKSLQEWIVNIRRDFHMYPEPSMQEVRTAGIIADTLETMEIETARIGATGVLGVLTGAGPGKVLALRADIDALSVEEKTGLPYSSTKPGLMHACGHDAHAAMLLGAAKILAGMRGELKGTVKFIFQPGEEQARGAKAMIAGGVLADPAVDMIVGMHVFAMVEIGTMIIQDGYLMAAGDAWQLEIAGKSGHGSSPWEGVDAITCAAAVIQGLQTVVSRVNDARQPVVINVGTIHGGERHNVTPGRVELSGMNRAFTAYSREMLPKWMGKIIANTCGAYGCTYQFTYEAHCDPVYNDERAAALAREAVGALLGRENIRGTEKIMASEDFSHYLAKVPGCMIILGGGNRAKGCWHSQHSNYFMIDEDCLPIGAASYAQIAADFLR